MFLNASSPNPLDLLLSNGSSAPPGGAVAAYKDSFANALTKNIVAMLVWLVLSIINSSMVYTFLQHRCLLQHPHQQQLLSSNQGGPRVLGEMFTHSSAICPL